MFTSKTGLYGTPSLLGLLNTGFSVLRIYSYIENLVELSSTTTVIITLEVVNLRNVPRCKFWLLSYTIGNFLVSATRVEIYYRREFKRLTTVWAGKLTKPKLCLPIPSALLAVWPGDGVKKLAKCFVKLPKVSLYKVAKEMLIYLWTSPGDFNHPMKSQPR